MIARDFEEPRALEMQLKELLATDTSKMTEDELIGFHEDVEDLKWRIDCAWDDEIAVENGWA